MNQSITDVIEIMTFVREQFEDNPDPSRLNQFRLNARNQIAQRRERTKNTIANAYIRELQPYIHGTREFQQHLNDWILNNSDELIEVITHLIPERDRAEIITDLQSTKTDVQKILDWEVMDSISQAKYPEGRSKIDIHLTKERRQQLVADAKLYWNSNSNGDVKCSVCEFSFLKQYGRYGQGFIEAHHKLPISELTKETVMKISDLAPVCSNCHRIIHRKRPFLKIDELRNIIEKQNSS